MPKREIRCLMLGLDASGKTALLYQMKLGETITTIPTIGFNVETVSVRRTECTMWDVGGQDKIRPLWRHYMASTNVLFFVVDASDSSRFAEARTELCRVLGDELKDAQVCVVANKQDLPCAVGVDAIPSAMGLRELEAQFHRSIDVVGTSALSGDGVQPLLRYLEAGPLMTKAPVAEPEVVLTAESDFQLMRYIVTTAVTEDRLFPNQYGDAATLEPFTSEVVLRSGLFNAAVPYEIITRVVSFLPLSDLLPGPTFHLSSKYGHLRPGRGAWLTSRTWMNSCFKIAIERMLRHAWDEEPLSAEDSQTFDAISRCVMLLKPVNAQAIPLTLALAASCVSLVLKSQGTSLDSIIRPSRFSQLLPSGATQSHVFQLAMIACMVAKRPHDWETGSDPIVQDFAKSIFGGRGSRENEMVLLDVMRRLYTVHLSSLWWIGRHGAQLTELRGADADGTPEGLQAEDTAFMRCLKIKSDLFELSDDITSLIRSGRFYELEMTDSSDLFAVPEPVMRAVLDVLCGAAECKACHSVIIDLHDSCAEYAYAIYESLPFVAAHVQHVKLSSSSIPTEEIAAAFDAALRDRWGSVNREQHSIEVSSGE